MLSVGAATLPAKSSASTSRRPVVLATEAACSVLASDGRRNFPIESEVRLPNNKADEGEEMAATKRLWSIEKMAEAIHGTPGHKGKVLRLAFAGADHLITRNPDMANGTRRGTRSRA